MRGGRGAELCGERELAVVVEVVLLAEEDHLVFEQGGVDRRDGRRIESAPSSTPSMRAPMFAPSFTTCKLTTCQSLQVSIAAACSQSARIDHRVLGKTIEIVNSGVRGRTVRPGEGGRRWHRSALEGGDRRRRDVRALHGGQAAGRRHRHYTIFETADEVGGTWRDNTYPGLRCDVPSRFYSYTFRPNPEWSHLLPPGAEIHATFGRSPTERGIRRTSGSAPR